jgi:CheY-like chemotaxis protein
MAPWNDSHPLVLIIDADETARDLYIHWFSSIGFQVMCAVGTLGLSLALRRERPQLIVTELRARDLTLNSLFVRLRSDESTRCIPVLVMTRVENRSGSKIAHADGAGGISSTR